MLAWKTRSTNPAVDTWHEGRFLEEWADPQLLEEFRGTCAQYHADDVDRALRSTADFFARLEVDCALLLGYPITVSQSELGSKLDSILDWSIGPG
jgi:aminoglycoside 6-adenylyltransferase